MKYSSLGLGITIIVFSLIFLKFKLDIYKVERDGQIVEAQIIKLPNYCGSTRGKYYMDLNYQGEIFIKRIPAGFCDKHKVGELIQIKYLEGEESILFVGEEMTGEFIAIGFFLLVGIVSVIYGMFLGRKRR